METGRVETGRLRGGPLKPSLVEWKLIAGRRRDFRKPSLKPSLVEWKLLFWHG